MDDFLKRVVAQREEEQRLSVRGKDFRSGRRPMASCRECGRVRVLALEGWNKGRCNQCSDRARIEKVRAGYVRPTHVPCVVCAKEVPVDPHGRLPKYCAECRARKAWLETHSVFSLEG